MSEIPFVLALVAGMVAAVNPCGFALLPAWLGLVLAGGEGAGNGPGRQRSAVTRALGMTAAMTLGFVAVFGAFGAVVTPLALSVQRYLPWATIVIGVALVALGGWLVSGRELRIGAPHAGNRAPTGSFASMVAYGVSYAVASLSCTIGPFLAVTTSTLRSSSVLGGLAAFVTSAVGMGLVVGVLAVAVALARQTLVRRIRGLMRYVTRASGVLLVVAGTYVAYYGAYELRVFAGASARDPVVGVATAVQGTLAGWLEALGPLPVALALAALVAAGTAASLLRRRTRGRR